MLALVSWLIIPKFFMFILGVRMKKVTFIAAGLMFLFAAVVLFKLLKQRTISRKKRGKTEVFMAFGFPIYIFIPLINNSAKAKNTE